MVRVALAQNVRNVRQNISLVNTEMAEEDYMVGVRRRRCVNCRKLTKRWQRINGSPWHCYDGCYSTTGWDMRTIDGKPLWLGGVVIKRWT